MPIRRSLVFMGSIIPGFQENAREKWGISIAAEGVSHSSQEGASSKGAHDEEQGAVIVRARVARLIFHAPIITPPAEDASHILKKPQIVSPYIPRGYARGGGWTCQYGTPYIRGCIYGALLNPCDLHVYPHTYKPTHYKGDTV
jgi:hypothetical protein